MIILHLAWHGFLAEYHKSDSRLIRWTQCLLIFFLLTLSFTSASVQGYLKTNLENLLGADMVISRYHPLTESDRAQLEGMSQRVSQTQQFDVTLTHKTRWQHVQLKIVDDHYPLQGQLVVAESLQDEHDSVVNGPKVGELWVGSRLFTALELRVGQALNVGRREFIVSRILFHEPDRILEDHSVAMRAMVNLRSLTGNPLNVDKKQFRYLIQASPEQQAQIAQWASIQVADAKVLTRTHGHPLSLFWKRVENFIGLSAVLLFCMAAIAIDLASRRQLHTQQRKLALLSSMGMHLRSGLLMSFTQWLLGFMVALCLATALAYGAQFLIMEALQGQFSGIKPHWHWQALSQSLALIFLLLISLQAPTFIQLKHTAITHLLRPTDGKGYLLTRTAWNLLCLGILARFYSDNSVLTAMVLGAMLSTLLVMISTTWLVLSGGEKIFHSRMGLLPLTFYLMKKRLLSKATQILGFGFCCTLLLFSLMLMKDIGQTLESHRRVNDGNLIVSKADANQISAMRRWCLTAGCDIKQMRPYTRAQLIRVNGQPLSAFAQTPSESRAHLSEPIRLSWSTALPETNRIRLGRWWSSDNPRWQLISVESEVMSDMGFSLGDQLSFVIGAKTFDFEITATHEFKPGKGSMTFWFQIPETATPYLSKEANTFYMGSLELDENGWKQLPSLWQKHPTLTLLPLKEITQHFDNTLALVIKLVLGFSAIMVSLTLIVVAASVKGFEAQDHKRNGLLLSMGVEKRDCLILSFYEWLITALISGVGAIMGTWVAGLLIYESQFSLTYHPNPLWIITILLIPTVLVCVFGLFACRSSLRSSINDLLIE